MKARNLPGFGLSMGTTLTWLSLLVLIPLSSLVIKACSAHQIWEILTDARLLAALKVSLSSSFVAALINVIFGPVIAWTLLRYPFPGRRLFDALVDIPFALPTAVAGITLTTLYAPNGWVGQFLSKVGIQVSYSWTGIVVALVFIGLPFVVRTVQPVLEELPTEIEDAAASLGASRLQTLWRVILPSILPSVIAGGTMAFARGLGEYGSVIFIAGNMPMKTEILPLLIVTRLEQFQYAEAAVVATGMLAISFLLLFVSGIFQARLSRKGSR
jgi:sulfate/thiosulfate transport system permease protein